MGKTVSLKKFYPDLLINAIIIVLTLVSVTSTTQAQGSQIKSAVFDFTRSYIFANSGADTWCTAWAGDDALYTTHCDGYGFAPFNPLNDTTSTNFGIDKISGNLTGTWPNWNYNGLSGSSVNIMHNTNFPEWDYGKAGSVGWWKTTGLYCINDVLYLFVSPNGTNPKDNRQTAGHVSLIKSTDHGATWSHHADAIACMFPGNFGAPFFVQYGKNGEGTVDGADKYVYAISNNGYMSNGDFMTLGRILKSKIGNLSIADWQFYIGAAGGDGSNAANWTSDTAILKVTKILQNPGNLSQSSVNYISQLKRYVLLSWGWLYDDGTLDDDKPARVAEPKWHPHYNRDWTTFLTVYEAPRPWGPWTEVGNPVYSTDPQAFYNPNIINKFTTADSSNPSVVHTLVAVAGEWDPLLVADNPYYKLTLVPLTLTIGNSVMGK
jgi:hypothetical protein